LRIFGKKTKALEAPKETEFDRLKKNFEKSSSNIKICYTTRFHAKNDPHCHEWLKAVLNEENSKWVIYKLKQSPNAHSSYLEMGAPMIEQKVEKEKLGFFDMIEHLSRYESEQPELMSLECNERRDQIKKMGKNYFRKLAEQQGLVFDIHGLPCPTKNGLIITEGKFPAGTEKRTCRQFENAASAKIGEWRGKKIDFKSPLFKKEFDTTYLLPDVYINRLNLTTVLDDHLKLLKTSAYYRDDFQPGGHSDAYIRSKLDITQREYAAISKIKDNAEKNSLVKDSKNLGALSSFAFFALAMRAINNSEKLMSEAEQKDHYKVIKHQELYFELCRYRAMRRMQNDGKLKTETITDRIWHLSGQLKLSDQQTRELINNAQDRKANLEPPLIIHEYLEKLERSAALQQKKSEEQKTLKTKPPGQA
jgi:hypothetical protein